MGLDRPLPAQYVAWLGAFVRGDWGYSYADGRPVVERHARARAGDAGARRAWRRSLAVPLAIGVASRRRAARSGPRGGAWPPWPGISLPVFWFGLVLQLVFGDALGWLPSSGRTSFAGGGLADRLAHLVLPAAVLAAAHAAGWSRYLRGAMRGGLALPFVNAARARGVGERRVLVRHVLRHALPPFATVVLLDASIMASGAVVTESVFAWPGLGSLFTEALARRDYTVLMAFLMCASVAVVTLSVIADVIVYALDPRARDTA